MDKVINLIEYKKSKEIKKINIKSCEKYINEYDEALNKMTPTDIKILQELLEN